jgi:Tol biopolymer transport system component
VRWKLVAILTAVVALAVPALAHATLVYETGVNKISVWVANDDGSGAKRLVAGAEPRISPEGQTVAYVTGIDGDNPELREMPVAGGLARVLLKPWRYGVFAWSPDSRYIAAQVGPLNGKQRLVLIDRTTGTARTIARGFFAGASFSPDGSRLVYSLVASDRQIFPKSNLLIAPTAGGAGHTLTHDGHSQFPVWGPTQIAYVRYSRPTGRHRHEDGPKFNLWLINPDGSRKHQLTHDRVPFLLTGLMPTQWSADGTRLLAQFGGQDTTYAVTVDPATGREHTVGKASQGIVGTGLSRDGSTVLGWTGGAQEDPQLENAIAVPYAGGTQTVLVKHAYEPYWNR